MECAGGSVGVWSVCVYECSPVLRCAAAQSSAILRPFSLPPLTHPTLHRSPDGCNLLRLPADLATLLTQTLQNDTFLCPNCLAGVHQVRAGRGG